jgi:hypothetical protein
MEFPVTGLIILVAAIWLFFFRPRWLYPALIISIPFSATAIVNFSMNGSQLGLGRSPEKSIMAFQLFTVLWIVREAFSRIPQWRRKGWFLTRRSRFWLLAFIGAVALSLCVPLLFNGTSSVASFEAAGGDYFVASVPLQFTRYNVTQFLYLAFGIMMSIFIAAENWHPARLLSTLKLYLWSCVFVAAWGLFQFWCYMTRHSYPAYIFNTSNNLSATGYMETIGATGFTWGRISSVVQEPSVLAYVLVAGLALLLVCPAFRWPIWTRGWNWLAIVLTVAALTASTSTTAYVGMFAILILVGVALMRAGKRQWKNCAVVAVAGLVTGAFLVERVPLLSSLADYLLLHKYSGMNSGSTRLESVKIAAQSFLHYPILGAGWPTVESWDLVLLILANMGIAGLLAFAAFLLPVFRSLWHLNSNGSFLATMVLPVLAWALLSAEGGGLSYGMGFFWLVFGLGAGAAVAAKMEFPATLAAHREGKAKWLPTAGVRRSDGEHALRGLGPQGAAHR